MRGKKNQRSIEVLLLAGASALSIMGGDIAVDIHLLSRLIEDINAEFGLTSEQIETLHTKLKVVTYSTIVGLGSTLVGRVMTREVLLTLSGVKLVSKNATRLVPITGQMVIGCDRLFCLQGGRQSAY